MGISSGNQLCSKSRGMRGVRSQGETKRCVPLCIGHKVPHDGPKDGHVDEVGDLGDEGRVFGLRLSIAIDTKESGVGHNFEGDSVGSSNGYHAAQHQEELQRESLTEFNVDAVQPKQGRLATGVERLDVNSRRFLLLMVVDGARRTQEGPLLLTGHSRMCPGGEQRWD